ncbi:MAG: hypothetical protein JNJ83_20735 [Verrucomicrobiaceae bacterium]|nr:hypothetical protein [Verrucomicrobiaceae bacterium]
MPTKKTTATPTIKSKTIWKTLPEPAKGKAGNQDRLILHVSDTHVYYASRGGNIQNPFNSCNSCQIARFLKAAKLDRSATSVEWKQAQKDLAPWIQAQGI